MIKYCDNEELTMRQMFNRTIVKLKEKELNTIHVDFTDIIERIYAQRWNATSRPWDKWNGLRLLYQIHLPEIIEAQKVDVRRWVNPYMLRWEKILSPIELMAWQAIRNEGNIVLYPQFPVWKYFIDFANPYLKIGLEVDGAAYHDIDKDMERDNILAEKGWKIFRVSGRECHRHFDFDDEENYEFSMMETCEGVIMAIKYMYFTPNMHVDDLELPLEVLDNHRLAQFEISKVRLIKW